MGKHGYKGNSLRRSVSMMISQVNLCLYCKSSSLKTKFLGKFIVVSSLLVHQIYCFPKKMRHIPEIRTRPRYYACPR